MDKKKSFNFLKDDEVDISVDCSCNRFVGANFISSSNEDKVIIPCMCGKDYEFNITYLFNRDGNIEYVGDDIEQINITYEVFDPEEDSE